MKLNTLLSEMYKEAKGSTATSSGRTFSVNKLISSSIHNKLQQFKTADLKWILKYTTVDPNRVEAADLSAPVLVINGDGTEKRLIVIDGAHRLTKAVNDGKETILGRLVTDEQLASAEVK